MVTRPRTSNMTRVVRRGRRRRQSGAGIFKVLFPMLKMVGKKVGRSMVKGAGKKLVKSAARGAAGAAGNFATQKLMQKVFNGKKKPR